MIEKHIEEKGIKYVTKIGQIKSNLDIPYNQTLSSRTLLELGS